MRRFLGWSGGKEMLEFLCPLGLFPFSFPDIGTYQLPYAACMYLSTSMYEWNEKSKCKVTQALKAFFFQISIIVGWLFARIFHTARLG
jgi:hypothetical protein